MTNMLITSPMPKGHEYWFLTNKNGSVVEAYTTRDLALMYKANEIVYKAQEALQQDLLERMTDRFGNSYKDDIAMAKDMVKYKTGIEYIDKYWIKYLKRKQGIRLLSNIADYKQQKYISLERAEQLREKVMQILKKHGLLK